MAKADERRHDDDHCRHAVEEAVRRDRHRIADALDALAAEHEGGLTLGWDEVARSAMTWALQDASLRVTGKIPDPRFEEDS